MERNGWRGGRLIRGGARSVPRLHLSVAGESILLLRCLQAAMSTLSILSIGLGYWLWQNSLDKQASSAQVEAATSRLQKANAEFSETMKAEGLTLTSAQLAETKQHVAFANELSVKRGFSWVRLLSELEEATPDHISFSSIQVNVRDKTVNLQGAARSLKDLHALVTGLEGHPAFSRAVLSSHLAEANKAADGRGRAEADDTVVSLPTVKQVVFTMTVSYAPPPQGTS